ncbi:MAG TPA: hypothetical protein VIS99_16915 [Terrimicrobiaceae bacterium]
MKTARFAEVVEAAGKPDTHLLLVPPEKDKTFQAAIKANRIMTLHQKIVGNNKDHGTVGFQPGRARQFLVFPKSLSKFRGARIVGINYDLLANHEERVSPTKSRAKKSLSRTKVKVRKPVQEKLLQFPKPPAKEEPDEESEAIQELKNQVRHAMEVLEEGRQVAAFNLLKRIVDR